MSQTSLKSYTYTLAAGVELVIARGGNFLSCTAATAAFTVEPRSMVDNFDVLDFDNGFRVKYPGQHFDAIVLKSTGTPTITVFIGDGELDVSSSASTISGTVATNDIVALNSSSSESSLNSAYTISSA